MKLTDISNNKAKEIIKGAPKEATHFSCIEGKTQYYKNETVISSLDEVFINVFRDIFQPSVFLLSDLENQMNIDKVETQTPEEKEALDSIQAKFVQCGYSVEKTLAAISELDEFNDASNLRKTPLHKAVETQTEHQEVMRAFSGEVEWKNGDECVISLKSKSKWIVVGVSPVTETSTVCISNTGELKSFHTDQLKKPETTQQREGSERLEAIDLMRWDLKSLTVSQASSLYSAGYRKEKSNG